MINKNIYREFCKTEKRLPIFSKDWWLDAVCGVNGWDVVVVVKDGNVVATLPYALSEKFGFKVIQMPPLTQTLGPYIKYPAEQKYESRLSYEKKIMSELIYGLPKFDSFVQNFNYSVDNWLPFFWHGYSQTTRYTYVIDEIESINTMWSSLNNKTRTDIRKADKILDVEVTDDIDLFYRINGLSFQRQGLICPYSYSLLSKVDSACLKHLSRRISIARDKITKAVHAAIYLVWDERSSYYLLGGADPKLRSSGGLSFLIWDAIKYSQSQSLIFDFEGGMIESIEKSFRSFGARQKPYVRISRINSYVLKMKNALSLMSK